MMNEHWSKRSLIGILLVAGSLNVASVNAAEPTATMAYEPAVQMRIAGRPADFQSHATTRCFDWDGDGDFDLFVGDGVGKLWLCQNAGTAQRARLEPPQPILAGQKQRWGDSYTGIVLADLVGSSQLDLIVAHSGNQISIHENTGPRLRPLFAESSFDVTVQANCQGRFDVADWDRDGRLDLICGSFGGPLMWYRNTGTKHKPSFASGESFENLSLAYNSQPRIVDFNSDGQLDLLLGVNWGSISLYLNSGPGEQPQLDRPTQLRQTDGSNISLRELNGDDSTPELVDLDGDGVLDLISGGKNGRLFFLRGIGYQSRVATLVEALDQPATQFRAALNDDSQFREATLGAVSGLQADLLSGLLPEANKEALFERLSELASRHPAVLGRQAANLETDPYLPILAGQFWVTLRQCLPDTPKNRQRVADALGFTGGYRDLLTEVGVMFIDNNQATPTQLAAMLRLIAAFPEATWDVDTITVAGWLGPAIKTEKIRSRTQVNIFDMPLGRPENSFANDAPRPGVTDVYLICLAHELAHNMLDTVGTKTRPDLYERKFAGLDDAAGAAVIYREPKSRGIDLPATQAKFRQLGVWDGDPGSWRETWVAYFKGKPEFDQAYVRGNVQFFLDAPQEAFATLANQYVADSQLMLEFCKTRWDAGRRSNVNQFLLIAEYLSERKNGVPLYVMRSGGDLTVSQARLQRDDRGRIVRFETADSIATFGYREHDLVGEFELITK